MKKCLILIALLIIALLGNNCGESSTKKQYRAQVRQQKTEDKEAITALIKKFNAISNWENKLVGADRFRYKNVLTVELEAYWIVGRPILAMGLIKDIETQDNDHYRVLVERDIGHSSVSLLNTKIEFSLEAKKEIIRSFFKTNPNFLSNESLESGVAVIALIKNISNRHCTEEFATIKTGNGELLAIVALKSSYLKFGDE